MKDLKEKEIEEIADKEFGKYCNSFGNERQGFIKGFQKCQELNETKWISVETELPPHGRKVNYCCLTTPFNGTRIDVSYIHNGVWQNEWAEFITHWMPLPEKP